VRYTAYATIFDTHDVAECIQNNVTGFFCLFGIYVKFFLCFHIDRSVTYVRTVQYSPVWSC